MRNLYSFIVQDWESKKTDQEKDIMLKYGQTGKTVSFICNLLGHGTIIARGVLVFFENLEIYRNHDLNATRTLYVEAYFPFDWNYSPVFEITCFVEYIVTVLATVCYCSTDGFFGQIAFHLCGQYRILRLNLLGIIPEIDNEVYHGNFDEKLSRIVNAHERINRFFLSLYIF